MKNRKITRKITQGMYVLTTKGGGCIVDAVSQISSSDNPLITVAVMKDNYTNKLIHENDFFALSVLAVEADPEIIQTFGYNSMRDLDKFANIKTEEVENIPIISSSLGYMLCEKLETIENETHTLFIGKLTEADVFEDKDAMSYQYFTKHKDEFIKVKTSEGKTAWVCKVCGYVYYGDTLPDDFKCPLCGVGPENFVRKED